MLEYLTTLEILNGENKNIDDQAFREFIMNIKSRKNLKRVFFDYSKIERYINLNMQKFVKKAFKEIKDVTVITS